MVGFARAVSDSVGLAYLADLFVLPEHRGRGSGHRLVASMVEDGAGRDFRWLLHTPDAHGLYADFGFAPPDPTLMQRPGARPAVLPPPFWPTTATALSFDCLLGRSSGSCGPRVSATDGSRIHMVVSDG